MPTMGGYGAQEQDPFADQKFDDDEEIEIISRTEHITPDGPKIKVTHMMASMLPVV